jgi:hypothetical protein
VDTSSNIHPMLTCCSSYTRICHDSINLSLRCLSSEIAQVLSIRPQAQIAPLQSVLSLSGGHKVRQPVFGQISLANTSKLLASTGSTALRLSVDKNFCIPRPTENPQVPGFTPQPRVASPISVPPLNSSNGVS